MAYGLLFSGLLVFPGCCQDVFLINSLAGIIGWARINRKSRIWLLLVFFGPYGGNGTLVFFRMRSAQFLNSMNFFQIPCMIELQLGDRKSVV